ncbi:hypothetical protein DPQ22_07840 [Candidatus Tokpelaia sp.]|nr:hypothetical protein DPQ22_07840 [Candidatus Tokpelaia sp.]
MKYYLSSVSHINFLPKHEIVRRFIMSRPPVDTAMTQADFENCGYRQVMETALPDYGSMRGVLCRAAENKFLEHKAGESAVLYLFADLCGMLFQPDSFNEPFRPYAIWGNRCSTLPDDLSAEQLAFIESIYNRVGNNLLRARLAEIVYLKNRKKFAAALAVIKAYSAVELTIRKRRHETLKCWERGIFLAQMLKDKGQEPLAKLEEKVTAALFSEQAQNDETYPVVQLANILHKRNLWLNKAVEIAKLLEAKARKFEEKGTSGIEAGAYYDAAHQWYHKAKMPDEEHRIIALKAAAIERYANTRKTGKQHNLASRHFLEQAIQEYRKLSANYRETHGIGSKLHDLQVELDKANKESLASMESFTLPPIDISPLQKTAENHVAGKTRDEALLHFCNMLPGTDFQKLEEQEKQCTGENILSAIARQVTINRNDGRVTARGSSGVAQLYNTGINLNIQAGILPALFVLRLEHRIREQDFYEFIHNNPLIPPDKEILAAKALYAGYEGDFIAALYMLAPLMEAIVRFHLKEHKVPTTYLDAQGIEQEKGLSTLITEPKCKEIFGENITEEIRLLFCDPMGANLRNNVAHGLVSDGEGDGDYSVYAWYLLFKRVFNTYYNMSKGAEEAV